MKYFCSYCKNVYEISEENKIPTEGAYVTCPKCKNKLLAIETSSDGKTDKKIENNNLGILRKLKTFSTKISESTNLQICIFIFLMIISIPICAFTNQLGIIEIWILIIIAFFLFRLKLSEKRNIKISSIKIFFKRVSIFIVIMNIFVILHSTGFTTAEQNAGYFLISIVIFFIYIAIDMKKQSKSKKTKQVKFLKKNEKNKLDEISNQIAEWGYEIGCFENSVITQIFHKLTYFINLVGFYFYAIHDMENRRALELRSGNSEAHAIDHEVFNHHVVDEIKRIAEACNQMQNDLDCNGFEELRYKGEHPFPSVFIFTHECKFLTIYGEEIAGIDAMVSILFEEIVKIQSAFNVDLLHHVARIEVNSSGVDMDNLVYETLAQPGIVKGQNRRRGNIPLELRNILLRDANYACVECGARAADGATLEVDHIVPFSQGGSDEYENLQILCATCNRKKGSKL